MLIYFLYQHFYGGHGPTMAYPDPLRADGVRSRQRLPPMTRRTSHMSPRQQRNGIQNNSIDDLIWYQ